MFENTPKPTPFYEHATKELEARVNAAKDSLPEALAKVRTLGGRIVRSDTFEDGYADWHTPSEITDSYNHRRGNANFLRKIGLYGNGKHIH